MVISGKKMWKRIKNVFKLQKSHL